MQRTRDTEKSEKRKRRRESGVRDEGVTWNSSMHLVVSMSKTLTVPSIPPAPPNQLHISALSAQLVLHLHRQINHLSPRSSYNSYGNDGCLHLNPSTRVCFSEVECCC
eukprot:2714939-Rhodomonas_salina.1